MPFFDMHCHLDFAPDANNAAASIGELGAGAFAVRVLPAPQESGKEPSDGLSALKPAAAAPPGKSAEAPDGVDAKPCVRWGVGLHPWWVADGQAGKQELERALVQIAQNRFVGEVGLDFGAAHGANQEVQLAAFAEVCRASAKAGGRVLSIHAVNAAEQAFDTLDRTGALDNCTCIFHWYSGPSDVLFEALGAGCFFSVGEPMLRSKRGREYARQIPPAQLLLETDFPPRGQDYDVDAMQAQLASTLERIAELKNVPAAPLELEIAATSASILA